MQYFDNAITMKQCNNAVTMQYFKIECLLQNSTNQNTR